MIKGDNLEAFIKEHCVKARVRATNAYGHLTECEGFFKVVKPLHVFKKVYHCDRMNQYEASEVIANLVIPVGALIYVPNSAFRPWGNDDDRKMRASEANVHSVVTIRGKKQLKEARSGYDHIFKYKVGATVKPTSRFSRRESQCAEGIHFFVNLSDAKNW